MILKRQSNKQKENRKLRYFLAISKAFTALPEDDAQRIWFAVGYLIGAIK